MRYSEITTALRTYIDNQWQAINAQWTTDDIANVSIEFPNTSIAPATGDLWIRFSFMFANAVQTVITGDVQTGDTIEGLLAFQIFIPQNTGDADTRRITDALILVCQGKDIEVTGSPQPITTGLNQVTEVGPTKSWYQTNVYFPFEYLVL